MTGRVIFQKLIRRADLQANPDVLFAYGDNMRRTGLGGQAFEMRGEPNAIGIPTKWRPSRAEWDFFKNRDWHEHPEIKREIDHAFNDLEHFLLNGGTIVLPEDGIGTGLAELPVRAPAIFEHIRKRMARLIDIADGAKVERHFG